MMKRETKSVRVDPKLWKKTKLQAVREDKTVSKIVEEGLQMRLQVDENERAERK